MDENKINDFEQVIKQTKQEEKEANKTEQKESEEENPSEKPSEEDDIEQEKEKIADLKKQKQDTEGAIEAVRKDLGIETKGKEKAPSVQTLDEHIKKAEDRIQGKEGKKEGDEEKEEKKEFTIEKRHCEHFISSARSLFNVFKKREALRLAPLLDEGGVNRIKAAIDGMEGLFHEKEVDKESFNERLNQLFLSLQKIGEAGARGPMRDDVESLSQVISNLKNIGNDSLSMIHSFAKIDPVNAKRTMDLLHKIGDTSQQKSLRVARMREALSSYGRR